MITDRSASVFVYGWFGRKNAGDDAILWNLSLEIQRRFPDVRFRILASGGCSLPEKVRRQSVLVKLSFFDSIRELTNSKVLIFAGGTHISDEGNLRLRRIRAHFAILYLTLWAKLMRIRIAHVSIGLGPLNSGLTRLIASVALRLADFVSVRDQASADRAAELNPKGAVISSLDVSLLSDPPSEECWQNETKAIGISILPFMKIYKMGAGDDDVWLQPLAQALNNLARKHNQLRFKVIEFSANDKYGDHEISERLLRKIESPRLTSIVSYSDNPDKMIQAVSCCTYFVGMRYHSILFSVSRHVPTVVLPYAEKCVDLAVEFGLRDSVIERERMVDASYIESRLEDLVGNPDKYTSDIERILQIQKSLEGIPSSLIFGEWMRE